MDLRTTQLKDTYGNLVTTGTTEGAPTSGGLQNGQGTLLTSVGIGTNSTSAKLTLNDAGQQVGIDFKENGTTRAHIEYDGSLPAFKVGSNGSAYLSLRTNNDEKLRIEADGDIAFYDDANNQGLFWDASTARLGLGTTSPDYKLQINGSGTVARFTDGTSHMDFYSGSGLNEIATASPLLLSVGGTERMRIDASGNVGIGTDSPSSKLTVAVNVIDGATTDSIRLIDADDDTTVGTENRIRFGKWVNSDGSGVSDVASIHAGISQWGATSGLRHGYLSFYTVENGSNTEKVRITDSGNVGIGTTSPNIGGWGKALTVQGVSNSAIEVTEGSVRTSLISAGSSAGYVSTDTNHPLLFRTNSAERMRIDTSGNVGIGTTSPTEKLAVQSAFTTSASDVFLEINSGHQASGGSDVTGEAGVLFKQGGSGDVLRNAGAIISGREGNYSVDSVADSYLAFETALNGTNTERMRIDSSGNVGIGTNSPTSISGYTGATLDNSTNGGFIDLQSNGATSFRFLTNGSVNNIETRTATPIVFLTNTTEAMRIDSSGNLLVGKTASGVANDGFQAYSAGYISVTDTSFSPLILNRKTTNGDIVDFQKDGTSVGSIGTVASDLYIGTTNGLDECYLRFAFNGVGIVPSEADGTTNDNSLDLGASGARFVDIYATNATIQTSDINEKQDIEELDDAELRVAQKAKTLLRKYRWKSSVEEKGDDARIHFGIIAQDLEQAFTDEGLDAGRYGMFIKSTWTNEDGEEQTRLGVRYNQLLAFIISSI